MRLSLPVFLSTLLVVFAAPMLHAQFGVYAGGQATRASSSGTSDWYGGFNVGLYDEFVHVGPVALGADGRMSQLSSDGSTDHAFLFGPRLSIHPHVLPIKPYVIFDAGAGGSSGASGNSYKFQYGVVAGVEYTILPHLDWRVVEFGDEWRSPISGYQNAPKVNLFDLSSGLVLRF